MYYAVSINMFRQYKQCLSKVLWRFLFTIHQQPDHLLDDADSAIKKLGKDRAEKESFLFRSLLENNALVAFGSDWPVSIWHCLLITIHHYAHFNVS